MTISLATLAIAAAVGLLSGAHAAIWGMYKDAIHEGFSAGRLLRSVIVGGTVALCIELLLRLPIPAAGALVVLFGLAYAAERGVATLALCVLAIAKLDQLGSPSRGGRVALVALSLGAIVAIGGAWKDAPKEGFQLLKFFRSPAMTVCFALLLSRLTSSYLEASIAAIGFERAAAETYKTFFFPSRPRGKFAGKPILHPEMLVRRQRFVPLYVAIWAAVLFCTVVALRAGATVPSDIAGALP
jgi:hypothetical protein